VNTEQNYVQTSYAEFHPNRTINVEDTDIKSLTVLSRHQGSFRENEVQDAKTGFTLR